MLNVDDRRLRKTRGETKMNESVREGKKIMLPFHANDLKTICVCGASLMLDIEQCYLVKADFFPFTSPGRQHNKD